MAQTCGTCGRSWGDRATFCGVCGALLSRPLPGRDRTAEPGSSERAQRRRPLVLGVLGTVALVGVVVVVPTLSLGRGDPVDTTIAVPDEGDLQTAPTDATAHPRVDPPQVSCTRAEVEFDCVRWSRALAPPAAGMPDDRSWLVGLGDHIAITSPDGLEVVDAATGTRLWRIDPATQVHPVGVTRGALLLARPGRTTLVDLDDGQELWSATLGPDVRGEVAGDDVVYTGTDRGASPAGLAARDHETGEVRWVWPSSWQQLHVRRIGHDRVWVDSGSAGSALVDATTGQLLAQLDRGDDTWALGVADGTVVTISRRPWDVPPDAATPAGENEVVLRGFDAADGSVRWQREVSVPRWWMDFGTVGSLVLAPSVDVLTALDAASGQVVWEAPRSDREQLALHGAASVFAVVPTDSPEPDVVITIDQDTGVVRARARETGSVAWEQPVSPPTQWWPAVVDHGMVLLQGHDGLEFLATSTGDHLLRVRVTTTDLQLTGLDPVMLFDHRSGHVIRLDVSEADGP